MSDETETDRLRAALERLAEQHEQVRRERDAALRINEQAGAVNDRNRAENEALKAKLQQAERVVEAARHWLSRHDEAWRDLLLRYGDRLNQEPEPVARCRECLAAYDAARTATETQEMPGRARTQTSSEGRDKRGETRTDDATEVSRPTAAELTDLQGLDPHAK